MKFCKTCFDRIAAKWAKRANYDPKHKLMVNKMVFPCQVPLYDHDCVGNAIVRVFDCKQNKVLIYTEKEYRKAKANKELPWQKN